MPHTKPTFSVPVSTETVRVRIVDSTTSIENLQLELLMKPPVDGLKYLPPLPSWSFLIEHPSGKKLLYDLGVARNWRSFPPAAAGHIDKLGWNVKVEREVIDVLSENGISPDEIDSIIWRLVSVVPFSVSSLIPVCIVTGIGIILEIPPDSHLVQTWWSALVSRRLSCLGILKSKILQFDKSIWRKYSDFKQRNC